MNSNPQTSWHATRLARSRCIAPLLLAALIARPAHAQFATRFDHGIVLGSDWLQANALPLNRDAVHSGTIDASLRRGNWMLDAGWIRIARDLSTVQGGFLSAGFLLHWKQVQFIPALGAFGGQAQESRDSTGYDFTCPTCAAASQSGHVARYSYSTGASFGGDGSFTIEVPLYRMIGVRGVVQRWLFSGSPLAGDRSRTTLGAGVSLRLGR